MRHCKFKYAGKLKTRYKQSAPGEPVEVDIRFPKNLGINENGLIVGMLAYIGMWIVLWLLI